MKYLLCCVFLLGLSEAYADTLFESEDSLVFTLTAPFSDMNVDRDKSKRWDADLQTADGANFSVALGHRGNRRLDKKVCKFPPVRIDFKKAEIKDTIFDKQNDIKLVVQCHSASVYASYLRLEYLVYKALSLVTPASYKVRWAEVTYIDSAEGNKPRTAPAFFVERKSRLTRRLGLEKTDVAAIDIRELEVEQAALLGLFQYLIANPDYSLAAAAPGEICCHNAKLMSGPGLQYTPVIYDFDSSGLINASYAIPSRNLGIKKVTSRLYRGYCEHNPALTAPKNRLLEAEDQMVALYQNDPILVGRLKSRAVKFLKKSFEYLKSPRVFEKRIIQKCR